MTRWTIGQKASRLLYFLMGLRNPRIATRLARLGFDQAALHEGWKLLRDVAGERLGRTSNVGDRAMIAQLDQRAGAPAGDKPGQREQELWQFYLQWSAIARTAITDRHQLRMLGFLKPDRDAQPDTSAGTSDNVAA